MIEEESNERIKIKFYFGGTIHGPKDGFKAAASGMTDLCPSYPVYSPGKIQHSVCLWAAIFMAEWLRCHFSYGKALSKIF